jgi:hypothetical protein
MSKYIVYLCFVAFLLVACEKEVPAHYLIEVMNETLDADITFMIAGDTVFTEPGVLEATQAEPGSQNWSMHIEFPNPPHIIDEVGTVEIDSHKRFTIYGERGAYEYRWDEIE